MSKRHELDRPEYGSRSKKKWDGSWREPGYLYEARNSAWVQVSAPIPGSPGYAGTAIMDVRVPIGVDDVKHLIELLLPLHEECVLEMLSGLLHRHHKRNKEEAEREQEHSEDTQAAA